MSSKERNSYIIINQIVMKINSELKEFLKGALAFVIVFTASLLIASTFFN